jgi:hypothetical protein
MDFALGEKERRMVMRLIDADRLLSEPMKNKYYHLKNGDTAVPLIDIKNAPTVDAVEVVRCRDCLYWQKSNLFSGYMVFRYVVDCSVVRREDDFCSRGERKDSDNHD